MNNEMREKLNSVKENLRDLKNVINCIQEQVSDEMDEIPLMAERLDSYRILNSINNHLLIVYGDLSSAIKNVDEALEV